MSRHVTRMFYAVAAGFALIASGLAAGALRQERLGGWRRPPDRDLALERHRVEEGAQPEHCGSLSTWPLSPAVTPGRSATPPPSLAEARP